MRTSCVMFPSEVICASRVRMRNTSHHFATKPLQSNGAIHHCAIALHHFGVADASLFTNKDFYAIIFSTNNFQKLFLQKAVRGILQPA